LFDQLKIERAGDEVAEDAGGAKEFVNADVDVLAVAGVEDHLLGVALDVADAEVISERQALGGH
jgi:hypothetical protein